MKEKKLILLSIAIPSLFILLVAFRRLIEYYFRFSQNYKYIYSYGSTISFFLQLGLILLSLVFAIYIFSNRKSYRFWTSTFSFLFSSVLFLYFTVSLLISFLRTSSLTMTHRNFIYSLIIIRLTLALVSCKTSPTKTLSITNLDTTVKTTKISISDLAKNYKLYQGQYIETTGQFYQAIEEFAIYTPKPFFGDRKGFWLESDMALAYDSLFFANANGGKVTIKGIVDTMSKGHLSMYLGTIRRIYFWKKH